MVAVADEHAQFVDFEGLQSVEDLADELRIDIVEIVEFELTGFDLTQTHQRLMSSERLQIVNNTSVENRNDADDPFHDVVLDADVPLGFDDSCFGGDHSWKLLIFDN